MEYPEADKQLNNNNEQLILEGMPEFDIKQLSGQEYDEADELQRMEDSINSLLEELYQAKNLLYIEKLSNAERVAHLHESNERLRRLFVDLHQEYASASSEAQMLQMRIEELVEEIAKLKHPKKSWELGSYAISLYKQKLN